MKLCPVFQRDASRGDGV